MRNRDTERQRYGGTDDTQETEDVPPLAASVKTLQEAVQLSLKDRLNKNCLFTYSRALKAFEVNSNRRLPQAELYSVFSLWWSTAKPFLPPDADFDEWRLDFEDTFAKTRAPLGANSLEEAVRRADANPNPPQAARYTSPKLKRLVAVCYHLQLLQDSSPFFLSVRQAARILEMKDLNQANAMLRGIIRDGILTEAEKGTRKRATRFRFKLPESVSPDDKPSPSQALPRPEQEKQAKPAATPRPKQARPSEPRKPTPCELDLRKKALQDLIKEMKHPDYWTPQERKEVKKLREDLARVNRQIAGVGEIPAPDQTSADTPSRLFQRMRESIGE